jgi:ABC-type multidrug transport system permease subunit
MLDVIDTNVTCASNEYLHFDPLNGTCGDYLKAYQSSMGGYLQDELATSDCSCGPISDTNVPCFCLILLLHVWRNFGIMGVYIVFNIFEACALYWWVRVPRVKAPENNV